jgi:hypothetical protein
MAPIGRMLKEEAMAYLRCYYDIYLNAQRKTRRNSLKVVGFWTRDFRCEGRVPSSQSWFSLCLLDARKCSGQDKIVCFSINTDEIKDLAVFILEIQFLRGVVQWQRVYVHSCQFLPDPRLSLEYHSSSRWIPGSRLQTVKECFLSNPVSFIAHF